MRYPVAALLLAAWPATCHPQASGDRSVSTITAKETVFIDHIRATALLDERGCGSYEKPWVHTNKARPCPVLSCGSASSPSPTSPPSCIPAPSSVAFPPFLAGVVDCTVEVYTGPACSKCGDNYCTRALLPGETKVEFCPFGFQHTTQVRQCVNPRCFGPLTLPPCPTQKPPVVTDLTSAYTRTPSCAITTETGWPCSGCPDWCTVAGAVPSKSYVPCQSQHTTTTTDRACPTLNCELANRPTVCPEPRGPVPTPWTETIDCAVYVQTKPDLPCPTCHEICYTPTPTAL